MKLVISVVIGVCLVAASIICSNMTERRITYCGDGVTGALKSAIFSAQVQMQAAGYLDIDGNGIGEYGFINHLSGSKSIYAGDGKVMREAGDLSLLTGPLAQELAVGECAQDSGYYFKVFLPDGRGGMYDYDAYVRDPDKKRGAKLREQHYLALAWPVKYNETGRRIYAMMEDGQLRSTNVLEARNAFMEDPDWRHLFKGREGAIEEILKQGPNEDWPYYAK